MPTKEETILSQSNEPYITIKKHMITELGLSGCQLLIYAIIAGFTETSGTFSGGVRYFEKEYGFSHPTVCRVIRGLIDKGLVVKNYEGGHFTYTTVSKFNHSLKTKPQSQNETPTVSKFNQNSIKNETKQSQNLTKYTNSKLNNTKVYSTRARPSAEDAAAAILKAMEEGV